MKLYTNKRTTENKKLSVRSYIPPKQEYKKEETTKIKIVLYKFGKVMKFIFLSTFKLCYNIANIGKYTSMTPLEIIVGIVVSIIIIIPIYAVIAVLWELFLKSIFSK